MTVQLSVTGRTALGRGLFRTSRKSMARLRNFVCMCACAESKVVVRLPGYSSTGKGRVRLGSQKRIRRKGESGGTSRGSGRMCEGLSGKMKVNSSSNLSTNSNSNLNLNGNSILIVNESPK